MLARRYPADSGEEQSTRDQRCTASHADVNAFEGSGAPFEKAGFAVTHVRQMSTMQGRLAQSSAQHKALDGSATAGSVNAFQARRLQQLEIVAGR